MKSIRRHIRAGFTLIELMMVVLLVAMMAMTVAPNLLPLLTMTEHENEARHLVGYGRAAMAHAAMNHESIVVYIDLDKQEYWAALAPGVMDPNAEGGGSPKVNLSSYGKRASEEDEFFDDDNEENDWIPEDRRDLAEAVHKIKQGDEVDQDYPNENDQEKVLNRQQDEMEENFAVMTQNTLFARAKRIKHDHPSFTNPEDRFGYREDEEDEAIESRPLGDPLLQSHRVIESVAIQAVYLGDEEFTKGIVEIALSPLGLDMPVTLELINEDSDFLQVMWDPMTGSAWFKSLDEDR